jgi:hypothetical protein
MSKSFHWLAVACAIFWFTAWTWRHGIWFVPGAAIVFGLLFLQSYYSRESRDERRLERKERDEHRRVTNDA